MTQAVSPNNTLFFDAAGSMQSDLAYSTLHKEIVSCRLRPGTRLRINEIAVRLNVSVSAVREALSRLAVEELAVATAQKGFSVTPISADEIKDLTKTRIAIEKLCLADALKNGDVEWESRIIAAFHRLSRTPLKDERDPEIANQEWVLAHAEFHAALTAACNSPSLLKIWRSLYVQTERYRQFSGIIDTINRDVGAEHRGLMEAALARDQRLIAERVANHFTTTMDIILRAI